LGKLKKFFKGKEEPEQAGTNEAAAVDSDLAPRNHEGQVEFQYGLEDPIVVG
jgi:hypothetical protein